MADTIFTDGTLYTTSKLDMLNTCLLAIGEIPFPEGTLIEDIQVGTDGDIARRAVEETMVEVQNRGWYFNTDTNYRFVPDMDGFISLSPNTLRVDLGHYPDTNRYVMRGKRIYDREEQTYLINKSLVGDIVWLIDFEELPTAAYNYIALRAARKFQQRIIGSTELAGFTQIDEQDALINMQREHMQYQDYNLRENRLRRNTNIYLQGGFYG